MVLGTAIYCTRVDEMRTWLRYLNRNLQAAAHDGFHEAMDGGSADPPANSASRKA